ncbi:MAG: C40 family peptidase [Sediminibacterium sp.]
MNTVKQYRVKPLVILALLLIIVFTTVRFLSLPTQQDNKMITVDTPVTQAPQSIKDTITQFSTDTAIEPVTATKQLSTTGNEIKTGNTKPDQLISFAETLIGTPYVWASCDPHVGFDCSGFITYVFNHFNIAVPRSSIDFTNVGNTVSLEQAKHGDLILFTGTDPLEKNIGHMGIVVSNTSADGLQFIHATSGKAMSVIISKLNEQYMKRFVRVSRVFSPGK